ncbi:piggyBac transposable element-derived protein 3-like [Homalodisca vitripennis]|uniref:piggyBac transposable element-derived protein 3-like n=1 Tax=Homalodisca vitripennis TaxID=197043 RepID=UPI001EEA4D67|nr:piggyBac transposable element-derived protein 3-like [Homalodisca vitripennis]
MADFLDNNWLQQLSLAEGFTVAEAVDVIENFVDDGNLDTSDVDIFIAPPENDILTDEDSGPEDEGGTINNLNGGQLSAPAEIRVRRLCNLVESSCTELQDKKHRTWIDGDMEAQKTLAFQAYNYSKFSSLSPVELFELFINNSVIELLVKNTNKYALFKNCPDPKVTEEEMKCFLAILLLSGYNELPGKKCYWDSGLDMKNEMVCQAMRRDRFIQIMRFLHCADNSETIPNDKMWKMRPLMNLLKCKCLDNFVPSEFLCFDESMVKYYGKHGCKQFLKGKPIRFGYKIWSLNTDTGYLINFEIFQGKNTTTNETYSKLFGKSAAPLVSMLDEIPQDELPYQLFFDNLFTSPALMKHLKDRGYGSTGTVRINRLPKDCPLSSKKDMQNESRGSFQCKIEKEDGIFVARWKDNSVVTVASTSYGIEPIASVKRFSQSEKKYLHIQQPFVIKQYNHHMGGTDLMDEDISTHRIGIRGKKWWWPLFTWLIDLGTTNAWRLLRLSGKQNDKTDI